MCIPCSCRQVQYTGIEFRLAGLGPAYLLVDHLFVFNISFAFFVFISYLHFLHSWKAHKQAGTAQGSVCVVASAWGVAKGGKWYASVSACSVYFYFFYLRLFMLLLCLAWLLLTCQHTQTQTNLWQRVSLFSWLAFFLHPGGKCVGLHLWAVFTAVINICK